MVTAVETRRGGELLDAGTHGCAFGYASYEYTWYSFVFHLPLFSSVCSCRCRAFVFVSCRTSSLAAASGAKRTRLLSVPLIARFLSLCTTSSLGQPSSRPISKLGGGRSLGVVVVRVKAYGILFLLHVPTKFAFGVEGGARTPEVFA